MTPRLAAIALITPAAAGLGCQSIDRYTTAPGESYCGAVTTTAAFSTGLAPGARMRLTLDASAFDGDASPGALWTLEDASGTTPARRLLDGSPLDRIPSLDNDPLATPDLGGGRDHTRVFTVTPAPAGEPPLLAVLSLRSDDGVEVRLLRPGVAGAPPSGHDPIFGLFTLSKQAGSCEF